MVRRRKASFTAQQIAFIDKVIAEGHYPNTSAVIQDGISILQERKQAHQRLLAQLEAPASNTTDRTAGDR